MMRDQTAVVDFLNLFSCYRESLIRQTSPGSSELDVTREFNDSKHQSIDAHLSAFFVYFFTKHVKIIHNESSRFVFVTKYNKEYVVYLREAFTRYPILTRYDVEFVIILSYYANILLDSNKDDFLCQYMGASLVNVRVITNDRYRDRGVYSGKYRTMSLQIIRDSTLERRNVFFDRRVDLRDCTFQTTNKRLMT